MTGNIIARRYAKALFALGANAGDAELAKFGTALEAIMAALEAAPEAQKVFRNPIFSIADKKAIIAQILDKLTVDGVVRNFCLLLADKDRLSYLPEIQAVFAELLDVQQGVLRGTVVTAVKLTKAKQTEIEESLAAQTKGQVTLDYEVDKDILGGLVLKVGDQVLDASLKAQLSILKENIRRGE